jgi:ribonuclease P/MRP protein subunit POP3
MELALCNSRDVTKFLLGSLLSPIGQHRANHLPRSKGKRNKKRKRQEAKKDAEQKPAEPLIPPAPEISSFVSVGLNSITRTLQESSQKPKLSSPNPSSPNHEPSALESTEPQSTTPNAFSTLPSSSPSTSFSAIFVLRSSQPSILHSHLPQLIATASLPGRGSESSPSTRLVQLPRGSDERVCQALGLPRASFVGLVEGAPHTGALVDLVRRSVPEIEAPWFKEAANAAYLPVKINAIETFASVLKKQPV